MPIIYPIYSFTGLGPAVNSMFDRLQVAQVSPLFNYVPFYGISAIRDVTSITGGGSVTNTTGVFLLSTSSSPNDTAVLDSAERGLLLPGNAFEAGVTVRIPTTPSGSQRAIWGYFDGTNGAYFGQDANGIYIGLLSGGVETVKMYQSAWNMDPLNGTGPSGLNLSTADGHMYQIRFGYSHGILEYRVVFVNSANFQQIVVCHRQSAVSVQGLLTDPNQPIRAMIQNGANGGSFAMNVFGRYFAQLGSTNRTNRITAERRLSVNAGSAAFVPTVSFQRKSIFPAGSGRPNTVSVQIHSFDIIASGDIAWQLRFGSTLTGASFGNVSDTPTSETACLVDVSATAVNVATGVKILSGLAKGGVNSGLGTFPVNVVLNGNTIVTLAVMSVSGNSTVHVNFRVHEDW